MTAVNALHRGLVILRAINDGHAQVREISAAANLPKSTIARMLETLVADGYVVQDDQKGYHVTARVLTLSRGYNAHEFLLKAALPVLEGLRKHQIWPSDLAVFDQDAMVILDTGRDPGTLSLNRTVGSRLPVLVTSLGRAFLGFADDELVERTLSRLARSARRHLRSHLLRSGRRRRKISRQTARLPNGTLPAAALLISRSCLGRRNKPRRDCDYWDPCSRHPQ